MIIFLVLAFLIVGSPAWAACTGASPTWTTTPDDNSLQTCLNNAIDNDTINVSAGSATWTTIVTVSNKSLKVIGAGADATIITDNITNGGWGFSISVPTGKSFRLSSMKFLPQKVAIEQPFLVIQGQSTSVRVDHITFTGWSQAFRRDVVYTDNIFGVFDNINWTGGFGAFLYVNHSAFKGVGQWGDHSWATPTNLGSSEFVFIEDSTFVSSDPNLQSFIEGDGNAGRMVVRHNTFTQYGIGGHGTGTAQRPRGHRAKEVYKNIFNLNAGADRIGHFRSGTGVIWGNTLNRNGHDLNSFWLLWAERAADSFGGWGQCDGAGQWDDNDTTGGPGEDGVYVSGTVSAGGDNTFTDNDGGFTWVANQWQGHVAVDVTNGRRSAIKNNTACNPGTCVFTLEPSTDTNPQNHIFNTNDSYIIRKPNYCLDQAGRGGTTNPARELSGPFGAAVPTGSPEEPIEPVRVWGNTGTATFCASSGYTCSQPNGWHRNAADMTACLANSCSMIACTGSSCAPTAQEYTPFTYRCPTGGCVVSGPNADAACDIPEGCGHPLRWTSGGGPTGPSAGHGRFRIR